MGISADGLIIFLLILAGVVLLQLEIRFRVHHSLRQSAA